MKSLLYIGNYLRAEKSNISTIHTLGPLLESAGYKVYYASDKESKIIRLIHMVLSVVRLSGKVDLVIIDTYSTLNFYYALIISQLCRLLKLPYITNLNGGNLPMRLENNPYLSRIIFGNARYNVAPSRYLKNAFQKAGYPEVQYIPNTIIIKNYPILEKEYLQPKLLWVRSFSKIYNPSMAVIVIDKLRKLNYAPDLCMVGPDSDGSLKEVKSLAEELDLDVTFTGKLEKSEWVELSKGYNIFINTTNFDNTPVSVIEAMALGLPVVSTNVGGMPYLIENEIHGLLVPPNDPEAMVTAVTRILKNPERRNYVRTNARRKVEQFDWENVKGQWDSILNSI